MDDEKRKELRRTFLTLWDKAVGTDQYVKDEWKRLDYLLDMLLYPTPRVSDVAPKKASGDRQS